MATFNKFNYFVEDVAKGVHNLATGSIKVALCASGNAPVATNHLLADLTEIAYTNLSARAVTTTSCVQTTGTLNFILADLILTASGTVAAFRYIVLYNDTPAGKNLIGWYDYGSALTLTSGETLTLDFDNVNGVLTLT